MMKKTLLLRISSLGSHMADDDMMADVDGEDIEPCF